MEKFAAIFVIIGASLWGFDGIVLRPALYGIPVPLVVFIESTIVTLILTPFFKSRFGELKNLSIKDWMAFIGVAVAGGAIGTMAITKALFYVNYVNLSIVVLIQKLQPVFAIIFAALFLKERLPKNFFFWAVLAVVGAYFMSFAWSLPRLDTGDKMISAVFYALVATISFGSSTVLSKRALKNVEFKLGTYLRFLLTSIVMLLIVSSVGVIGKINTVSSSQIIIFLLIAFSTGGPAIFLYFYGLKKISASVATICELAFPLTAVLLEYFIRGNTLNWVQWGGVLILLISIIRVTQINTRKSQS